MPIHWFATYLDPWFRELGFVKDRHLRCKQQNVIQDALLTMVDDINSQVTTNQGRSEDVCVFKASLNDLAFTFRLMFFCRYGNEEKTVFRIVIHLQIRRNVGEIFACYWNERIYADGHCNHEQMTIVSVRFWASERSTVSALIFHRKKDSADSSIKRIIWTALFGWENDRGGKPKST